ncbi:MAG: hypothetical protein M3164_01840 [Actinomycetota bacterium]|nr:hypothetical protein [Actinomycetota bacterium]
MILRILGSGQYRVGEEAMDALNKLDDLITQAVESNDDDAFAQALGQLLAAVREQGEELPEDYLGPSDLVLPGPDSTIEEVRDLLTDEGLIPG